MFIYICKYIYIYKYIYVYIYMCVYYSRSPEWYIYIHVCINYLLMHWPTVAVFFVCGLCSYANSYIGALHLAP